MNEQTNKLMYERRHTIYWFLMDYSRHTSNGCDSFHTQNRAWDWDRQNKNAGKLQGVQTKRPWPLSWGRLRSRHLSLRSLLGNHSQLFSNPLSEDEISLTEQKQGSWWPLKGGIFEKQAFPSLPSNPLQGRLAFLERLQTVQGDSVPGV